MGFLLVTAVLVVSLGRVGDIYGRVKMYNLGFAVFTLVLHPAVGDLADRARRRAVDHHHAGLPGRRRGVPVRQLDRHPDRRLPRGRAGQGDGHQRHRRGQRLVHRADPRRRARPRSSGGWCSWSRCPSACSARSGPTSSCVDNGIRIPAKIDWLGNAAFAVGLIALLTGIVYSLLPYGGHPTGWTNPWVLTAIFGGIADPGPVRLDRDARCRQPMFRLSLFRIRAFTAGNIAGLLGALGRGGIQFMLIIWLQGIWLPQHGYSFARTPLWAGIYMIPLTVGFLLARPDLRDRCPTGSGRRLFATAGLIVSGVAFLLLELLPINFSYIWFALLIFLFAVGMGLFFSPNQAAVMNSLPPDQRGAGAGMLNTFQNSATVLSMGLFFTIVTLGLAARPAQPPVQGAGRGRRRPGRGHLVANEPPIGSLFSAFLGYNPIKELLGPTGALQHLTASRPPMSPADRSSPT